MLQLLNPWMLLGLAAIILPVLIHLLHRYRVKSTSFAGMRFLDQVMVRLRRKLRWQGIMLLALRCLALLLLALALSQPLWRAQRDYSQLLERQGATASVVIFDNSASSHKQFQELKDLAHSYINTLRNGDAISIVSLGNNTTQTLYDFSAAHILIDRIATTDANSDLASQLQEAETAMRAHVNPYQEIIIITDGQQSAWNDSAIHQLQQLQSNLLREDSEPRCIVLNPTSDPQAHNSSIRLLQSSQQVLAVGQRCLLSIAIQHQGAVPQQQCLVRIRADGRIIEERIVNRTPGVEEIIHCEHQFSVAGSHYVSAELVGLRDSIPADNVRFNSLSVTERIPVLLIDSHDGRQLRHVTLALEATTDEHSPFAVSRCDITEINTEQLAGFPVVVLADTAALDSQSIATIERYIVGGGNLIVLLGEASEPAIINSLWSRNGDGFLPCNIGERISVESSSRVHPQFTQSNHPAFATLTSSRDDLFAACHISQYYPLDTVNIINDEQFSVLMELNTGDAFLVERHRGQGRVLLLSSSFDLEWNDITVHGVFVPWIRSLCSYLSSFLLPPRNIHCGEPIIHLLQQQTQHSFVNPDGKIIKQQRGTWQGHAVRRSDAQWQAGLYAAHWKQERTWYAVNVPESEHSMQTIDQAWLQEHLDSVLMLRSRAEIEQSWGSGSDSATALWPTMLILSLLCFVSEMFYARHLAQSEAGNAT